MHEHVISMGCCRALFGNASESTQRAYKLTSVDWSTFTSSGEVPISNLEVINMTWHALKCFCSEITTIQMMNYGGKITFFLLLPVSNSRIMQHKLFHKYYACILMF